DRRRRLQLLRRDHRERPDVSRSRAPRRRRRRSRRGPGGDRDRNLPLRPRPRVVRGPSRQSLSGALSYVVAAPTCALTPARSPEHAGSLLAAAGHYGPRVASAGATRMPSTWSVARRRTSCGALRIDHSRRSLPPDGITPASNRNRIGVASRSTPPFASTIG